MRKTVVIDCFPERVEAYRNGYALVAVDVIRATTTAVTCVTLGRRCFPVPSLEEAVPLAARLPNPLLVGELGGSMPYGFDLNNGPADLESRTDTHDETTFRRIATMDADAPAQPPADAALDVPAAVRHLEELGDQRLADRLRGGRA